MFCIKCGAEIKENAKFCAKCGTPVNTGGKSGKMHTDEDKTEIINTDMSQSPIMPKVLPEPVMTEEVNKKDGKGIKKAIGIVVLIIMVLGLIGAIVYMGSFFAEKTDDATLFSGRLEQAQECMEEDDYEGAISYYLEALEMAPEKSEIYEDLAEAYQKDGKLEKAIMTLETGYEVTEDEGLLKMVQKISGETDDIQEDEKENEVSEENAEEKYVGERQNINLEVRQVDNTNFPEIVFYASITDETGNAVENLDKTDFNIQEIDANGNVDKVSINDVYQVLNEDNINVNLVLDASGSMSDYDKMQQAKNAANAFIGQMGLTGGDKVEVISFDNYVYLEQEFTNQEGVLQSAINNIQPNGGTALYDALYAGLFQTYYENGAKCVIGFTDGLENASSYSFDEVVAMAQNTGIPVFIIGIGEEYDAAVLQDLAAQCSGRYYSANVTDLQTILEDIYLSIYREQQDYYVFKYTSKNLENPNEFREIVLETSETTEFYGSYRKAYVPQADISGAFSAEYMNKDYILDFTGNRSVTEADLQGLSLAELRIARNEIFARHGRQFKDVMLNQWFYSKTWYLNLPTKYAPDDFDAIRPSPLSKLEIENVEFIKAYENSIMSTQDIYPVAGSVLLSDYDLALSKAVLRTALSQIQNYASTDILEQNKRLLQETINKEDVQY